MAETKTATSSKIQNSVIKAKAIASVASDGDKLVWGAKVSEAFRSKVKTICKSLGINPDYLMSIMAFESGETFSPSKWNGKVAVGLIQFTSKGAKRVGKTKDELAAMTAEEQLDYVEKFFDYPPYKKDGKTKLLTLEDLYMAVLWPSAVGKDNDFVLFDKEAKNGKKYYDQNKGFDNEPEDGKITKKEASALVRQKMVEGYKHLG